MFFFPLTWQRYKPSCSVHEKKYIYNMYIINIYNMYIIYLYIICTYIYILTIERSFLSMQIMGSCADLCGRIAFQSTINGHSSRWLSDVVDINDMGGTAQTTSSAKDPQKVHIFPTIRFWIYALQHFGCFLGVSLHARFFPHFFRWFRNHVCFKPNLAFLKTAPQLHGVLW